MYKMLKKMAQYRRLTLKYPREPLDTTFVLGQPRVHHPACTLCGHCVKACPTSAMWLDPEQNKVGIKLDECIFCYQCVQVCPVSAVAATKEFELAEDKRHKLWSLPAAQADTRMDALGAKLEKKINKLFGRSLQIREVDAGSCNGCDYEINALNNPFNDLERFGIHFVASPRHADMLLVTGAPARNMEIALRRTFEATPDPKLVVAVGACACSGGIFKDSYATKNGIDTVIPVDMYIPGCPPRPQAILYGILKALDRV